MKSLLITFLLIVLLCSCKKSINRHDITKITFASGYCHGECPFQAIEIDSSLTYKYYGGEWAENQGYFLGTIDKDFWDSLNTDVRNLKFEDIDSTSDNSPCDQSLEIIIYNGNERKYISNQEESLPKGVQYLFSKLHLSVGRAKLRATQDTIIFETTLQKPPEHSGGPRFPPENYKKLRLK